VRAIFQDFLALLTSERSFFLFLLLHLVGLHGLAGAKSWWTKAPAALCLLVSVGFYMHGMALSPSILGANQNSAVVLAGLGVLGGVWLAIAGRTAKEWGIGFSLTVVGVAALLFASGHRYPAAACFAMVVPLVGAIVWFSGWSDSAESEIAPGLEWLLSGVCAVLLALAIGIAQTSTFPLTPIAMEARPRLRDLVSHPAATLLVVLGAGFSSVVAVRLWPSKEPA
jgi:hypothetical protein